MGLKGNRKSWTIRGFVLFIIIFIFVMTWFYPYSPFSINKSFSYQPDDVLHNDKSYKEILSDFKDSYEKDLNADSDKEFPNLTIIRTQYVLPIFEQDWLMGEDSVAIDARMTEKMLVDVRNVREVFLSLVAQVDYTNEQRGYLIDMIRNFLVLEDSIIELNNEKFTTRSALNRRLGNLYNEFTSNFMYFMTFYDWATNE